MLSAAVLDATIPMRGARAMDVVQIPAPTSTQSPAHSLTEENAADIGPEERLAPPPVSRDASSPRPWRMYAIVIPAVVLLAEGAYFFRDPLVSSGSLVVDSAMRWMGPVLVGPFAALLAVQLMAMWGLATGRRRRGPRTRLTPGGLMEFVINLAPTVGFLGTVLGMATFLGGLESETFRGLDDALGTTAFALAMVIVGQTVRVLCSNEYRLALNQDAGHGAMSPEWQDERP